MKNVIKIIVFIIFLAIFYFYINFFTSFVFPWEKKEAIETTLNWGGLSELPSNVKILIVKKEGSFFTRTFIIEFISTEKQINEWILNSKRLKNNSPKIKDENKTYEIYPGENNSFGGKVYIDKNLVKIKMSWS